MSDDHERFMQLALILAKQASERREMPVGSVVVVNGSVIGRGFNRIETDCDPTAHAEMLAIKEAAAHQGDWRLHDATLYATVEPCIMCAAAILHARVKRVVYGTPDQRWGGFGSLFDLAHDPRFNHQCELITGVMEQACAALCSNFFREVRRAKTGSRADTSGGTR